MRSSAVLASNPQNPNPGTGKNIFCGEQIPALIVAVANTLPTPVAAVTFQGEHVQHGGEGCIGPDKRGRIFFLKTGKDIAMMKIYRYHPYDG